MLPIPKTRNSSLIALFAFIGVFFVTAETRVLAGVLVGISSSSSANERMESDETENSTPVIESGRVVDSITVDHVNPTSFSACADGRKEYQESGDCGQLFASIRLLVGEDYFLEILRPS